MKQKIYILALFLISSIATFSQQVGDGDQTFGGGDGIVVTDFGSTADEAYAVALQPDGKIVVAGYSGPDWVVVRYNPDGTLDSSFGNNGKVGTSLNVNGDVATSVLILPDGRILVGGITPNIVSTLADFALIRYNSNGTLDSSFGTNGIDTTDFFNYSDDLLSMALQTDGKIVAAGRADLDYALARYNSDGGLDISFGTNGRVVTELGGNDVAQGVAIRPNGKIVAAGLWSYGFTSKMSLAQYNSNGTLDSGFGTNGKVVIAPNGNSDGNTAYAIAIQPDGKVIVGGSINYEFGLVRFNENGTPDSTFGTNGIQSITFFTGYESDVIRSLAIQPDGKIIAMGSLSNGGSRFAMARFNTDGDLDSTFGNNGKATSWFANSCWAYAACLQPDGKIVAAGTAYNGTYDIALVRYIVVCVQETFYADADSDGFGSLTDTIHSCSMPPGYLSTDSSDCDDADANVRPDAYEIPDNGIDDDCDGYVDECSASFYVVADTLMPQHYWGISNSTGISPFSYVWDWADGYYDSIPYPSHTYEWPSAYDIILTIKDSTGCISSYTYTAYLFKLSATEGENNYVQIDIVDTIPGIPTTVLNSKVLQAWSVFPNPASGNSFVQYTLSAPATVSIDLCDVLGNKLQQLVNDDQEAGEHNSKFDARQLANGIYLLQIRAGDQIASQKIVVMN